MRFRKARQWERGLGWFSVGMGLAEIVFGGRLARAVGLGRGGMLIGLYGARELATGVGILTQRRRAPWIRARLAGDVLDLATLGWGVRPSSGRRTSAAIALATVAAVTAIDTVLGYRWKAKIVKRIPRPVWRGAVKLGMRWPALGMRGAQLLL